jgi:hypothetical protein
VAATSDLAATLEVEAAAQAESLHSEQFADYMRRFFGDT